MNNIRIKTLQRKIKLYYKKSSRLLPWRKKVPKNQDPYKTLISEIMLQQTRVNTVLGYYKGFLKKFPDIKSLALAKEQDILLAWAGLGYYRRAINLHKTAKAIVLEYNGIIPSEKILLKKLPGIGEYTSSAIASFAYGKEELIIDTNIERFINRIFNVKIEDLSTKKTKYLGEKIFPAKNRGDFAQAIMDFSNDYCTKINPKCKVCIISKYCNYKELNPAKVLKGKKTKKFSISYFIYDVNGSFLVRRRSLKDLLGGMYEVPSSLWGLRKDLESNNLIKVKENYAPSLSKKIIKHEFSHFTLLVQIILVKKEKIKKNPFKGQWVNEKTIRKFPISSLTRKIVNYSLEEVSSLRKSL